MDHLLIANPHVKQAQEELAKHLAQFMGAPVTEGVVAALDNLLEDFRVHKLLQGVPLPKMRVVAIPSAGYFQVWPAEMEEKDMKIRLKNLIKVLQSEHRRFSPEDLAKAIRRAYPEYSPSTTSLKFH